jgi:hypothetical protein
VISSSSSSMSMLNDDVTLDVESSAGNGVRLEL